MRKWLVASSAILLAVAARGQVKVMDSEDVVKLVSGEEIKGKVLGSGLKAVVIVVKGEDDSLVEKTIPREQVESVTRGDFSPTIKFYSTEIVHGMKVVSGETDGEEDGGAPAAEAKPKARAPRKKKDGGKRDKTRPAGGGQATPNVSRKQLESLMKSNPSIKSYVRAAGGIDKAMALYGKNPQVMKMIRQFMESGKLPGGLPKR